MKILGHFKSSVDSLRAYLCAVGSGIRTISLFMGSGCGSVGRAVAFDTRGPRFDTSHRQNFIEHLFVNLFNINCIEKTKINKKRPGMAHF